MSHRAVPSMISFLSARTDDLDWQPMGPGIETAKVLEDPDRDFSVMFLKMAPGAEAVRHIHPDGEQYLILEGALEDENGRFEAGTFVNNPPGSIHAPRSPDGALVLVTWFGRLVAYEE